MLKNSVSYISGDNSTYIWPQCLKPPRVHCLVCSLWSDTWRVTGGWWSRHLACPPGDSASPPRYNNTISGLIILYPLPGLLQRLGDKLRGLRPSPRAERGPVIMINIMMMIMMMIMIMIMTGAGSVATRGTRPGRERSEVFKIVHKNKNLSREV